MRSKLLKLCSLSFGISLASTAVAAVAVTPETNLNGPNALVKDSAGLDSVYYLDTTYVGQGAPLYRTHAFNGNEVFYFNISGADTTKPYFWVYAVSRTSATTYYPVPLFECTGGTIGADGRCDSLVATDFRIGINFTAVCASGSGSLIRGCTSVAPATVDVATSPITGFDLRFVSTEVATSDSPTAATGTKLQVIPQVSAPTILTNIPSPGFFPGDTSILVEISSITAQATAGSSPSFAAVWVVAEKGGTVTTGNEMAATLRQSVSYLSGQQEIPGFENSTNDTQIFYEMAAGVQDSAGAMAFGSHFTNVFSTNIQGFLRDSNCFIATASYRDGNAPGVMLLRNFRDEVLSRFEIGRDFIRWYYAYGPLAADWLIEHPVFRSFFLMLLMPLQAFAWITLHPMILILPILGLVLFGFFLRRNRGEHA